MPFLRVIRDKRGYETTYLMHWYREGARQRSRILYVFRTPGGVRVGCDPLSPEVLRQIEATHPDIVFDWNVVRDNQQVIESSPEQRRRRPRRDDNGAPPPAPPAPARETAPPVSAPEPPAAVPPRPPVPSAIQGDTADAQVAFLSQWYPQIVDRIQHRVADPARRDTLLTLAERLNPGAWTDADQITTGLQQAREALERLSRVLAKRRRRPRRKPSAAGEPAPPDAGPADSADSE